MSVGYATLTPAWQNPDEPAHFNYVGYVAKHGGLPELQAGDWNTELLERLKNGTLRPGEDITTIRYESWQPPLFYVLAAPIYSLGPSDPPAALLRLRLFDVVIGALTLGVAYFVGRELLPDDVALAVPMIMVGVPMYTAVDAAISADPLANLLAALILLVLARTVNERVRLGNRRFVGAGALVGIGLLTKLALAIFLPLGLVVVAARAARPLLAGAVFLCAAFVVTVPWLVHQVTTYGLLDPLATARHAAVVVDQPRFPGLSWQYLVDFATISFHSFWAQVGWMGIVAPDRLYWAYGVWVGVALFGLLRHRKLFGVATWRLVGLTSLAAVAGLVAYNLTFEQFQGRYLFPALVAFAALLARGWAAWLPRGAQRWGVLLVGVFLVGLNAYALTRVLVPGFAPTG